MPRLYPPLQRLVAAVFLLATLYLNQGYAMPTIDFDALAFTCSCEADHTPVPPEKAEALFQDAYREHMQATKLEGEPSRLLMKLALQHYQEAAKLGHWKAVRNLAALYTQGWGEEGSVVIKPSQSKAFDYAQQLADMGVGEGYALLASMAHQGWGTKQNAQTALQYQRKAADHGHRQSQFNVGYKLTLVNDLPKKDEERVNAIGRDMMACAVRQGHAQAAKSLAVDYETVAKNYPYALFYYQQGGKLGNGTSLYALYEWFRDGQHGYAKDPQRAKLYEKYSERTDNSEGPFPNLDKELPLPPPPDGSSYPAPEFGWPNAWTKLKPAANKK